MQNIISLTNFFSENNLKSDDYGNYKFNGKVEYFSNIKNVVEFSEIKITMAGYNGGKISINEAGELNVEEFHLDFEERFQKYNYENETKELVVSGKSGKMNGKYTVRITAV